MYREGAIQELCRLPGVSRRAAAELFDDHNIDCAQALRNRLADLQGSSPEGPQNSSERKAAPTPTTVDDVGCPGILSSSDQVAFAKLFPTRLSTACVLHSDSFAAPMDTEEFDEWQQQLLLVQDELRRTNELVPRLPGSRAASSDSTASLGCVGNFQAVPVMSLGGGIFCGNGSKLTSLSLQVSLLPSWTEEGDLPATLERAVCSGGEGAGPEENSWLLQQWKQVSLAYRTVRPQLHRKVVEALMRRNLISEIIEEHDRTKPTHAAGRLPWRHETYRLVTFHAFHALRFKCPSFGIQLS